MTKISMEMAASQEVVLTVLTHNLHAHRVVFEPELLRKVSDRIVDLSIL